ncbi:MAG TPA: prephenate dehydratase [Syntrophomonas sp.]|nr:prephenate dehydratase [Syntrophomonas sp.]
MTTEKIAYLGPGGTFCEEAARRYREDHPGQLLPLRSIREVFQAVAAGEAAWGIVPIENSYEGAVNQTLDLMTDGYALQIAGEIIIPVRQNLLIHPQASGQGIDCILSHPQALAQCQEYLSKNYAGVPVREVCSTAEAARMVASAGKTWAAVAALAAAGTYGLKVLEQDIQDQSNNSTRFVVLAQEDAVCSHGCKTSLLLYAEDRPGALYEVLQQFYLRGVNLCKIESRPARTRIGEYLFFIDFEGHRQELPAVEALKALQAAGLGLRVLGSYPAASLDEVVTVP